MTSNYYTLDIMARSISQERLNFALHEQLSALARRFKRSNKTHS